MRTENTHGHEQGGLADRRARMIAAACALAVGTALAGCSHSSAAGGAAPRPFVKGYPQLSRDGAPPSPAGGTTAPGASAASAQTNAAGGPPPLSPPPPAPPVPPPPAPAFAAAPPPPPLPPLPRAASPAPSDSGPAAAAPRALRPRDRPMPLVPDGPRFAVRGVDASDVLFIRAEPGTRGAVVGQIPPQAAGIVGTGARQNVGGGVWREVIYDGVQGWVNARFLVEESR